MGASEFTRASLRDILNIIFKRKYQILLFFFVTFSTVVIGTLGILLYRPVYEAKAQILVKMGRESIYNPATGGTSPVLSISYEDQINSEIEILRSRYLSSEVVAFLGPSNIYPDDGFFSSLLSWLQKKISPWFQNKKTPTERALLQFQKNLKIQGIKRSNVIEISFKHIHPQIAALVVNTLANQYLDRHVEVHKNPNLYEFFKEQSESLEKELGQAESRLKAFKKQHRITELDEQQKILLQRFQDLRMALNQTLSEKAAVQKRIQLLDLQLQSLPKNIAKGKDVDQNPFLINTLESRLVDLQLEENSLLTKYNEQNRLVQNVRDEIRVVQKKLTQQEAKRYGRSRSGVNPIYQNLQEELLQSQGNLKALKAKSDLQLQQLADYGNELAKLNHIEVQHNQLEQKVEVGRQNYRLYLTKFEEARISDAMDSEKMTSVSLIEPAQVPIKPVSPRVLLNVLLGFFLGVFGALGLAFFMHYLDDSLETVEDVEEALQLPVLASIPELSTHASS